jgi:hypothetical protein
MIFTALVCVVAAAAISAPAAPLVPKATPDQLDTARPTELVRDGCGYGLPHPPARRLGLLALGPLRSEVVGERCVSAARLGPGSADEGLVPTPAASQLRQPHLDSRSRTQQRDAGSGSPPPCG